MLDTNQSAFCRATTLFTESGQVWNKGLNWPVCAEFRFSNSVESNSSFYRPPTKLREGNVFIGVCQSFCSKERGVGDNRGYGWQAAARILLECFLVKRWGDSWNLRFELTEILFYSNFRFRFTLPNQNKNLFKLNVWKDFYNRENVWTVAELSWSEWENPYHFFRTIRRKPDIKIYCRTQYETSVNGCYWRSSAGW